MASFLRVVYMFWTFLACPITLHQLIIPLFRYIFSTEEKLQELAVVLRQHDRRDLLGRIRIGVLYESEVTCVGMRGVQAQMISYREGEPLARFTARVACRHFKHDKHLVK